MSGPLEDIGAWLTLGGALVTAGVTLGALPRFSAELKEFKAATRAELDKLWARDEHCANDRRRLSERLGERHQEHH